MRTIVLGSQGQLGRDLCPLLAGEVVSLTRADADLTDPARLRAVLAEHRPELVINCAAYNFVDKAENEPEAAFGVNTWAMRELARVCSDLDARLVHFSTDYVFGLDTSRTEPFTEEEPPGPVSVYGLSKLTGEYQIRSLCKNHLIIRTCGLYGVWGSGGKGGNFVETMLRVAGQGKPLRVVADQRCTPSYTADVAAGAAELIRSEAVGLFHLTNSEDTTWHDLAAEIFRQSNIDADLTPISSEEFGAPAQRPKYSSLNCDKAQAITNMKMRSWKEALSAYLQERRTRTSSQ